MKTKTLVALGALSILGMQIPGYAGATPPPSVNLVYVPVEPCRVADTRNVPGGNLVANTPKSFFTYGDAADIGGQGGNAGGCPNPKTQIPAAAFINITAVGRQVAGGTAGSLVAYAAGGSPPAISILNITGGQNTANGVITQASDADGQVALKSTINVPVMIDVLGYYYPQCQ